ncbi:MAG TPA: amidohydrolase [Gryllotalpicola sp.]
MFDLRDVTSADVVLEGGTVRTLDEEGTISEAVAVKGNRIVATGTTAEIRQLVGPHTTVVELAGRTVLPGFGDVHLHLASDAANAAMVDVRDLFTGIHSIPQILEAMRAKAAVTPKGEWVVGRGSPIQELRLDERRRLTREDLDPVLPDHPAYVSFGAHVTQANSLALKEKGITRDTPEPAGGTIVKDPVTGEPTGVLLERAQFLVKEKRRHVPQEELEENVLRLLEECRRNGATTIHEIVASPAEVLAYVNLANKGLLPIRVQLIVRVIESEIDKEALLQLGVIQGMGSDMLKIGGIKMSVDGGTTGRNGAFSEPLTDGSTGIIRIEQAELDDTVMRYHKMGMRICTHTVGDVAHAMTMKAYEKALTEFPRADHRHRIEHFGNWMFTQEKLDWATRFDVLPMPNPTGLRHVADIYEPLLGPERFADSYRFGTIIRAGFKSSFGSDGPGGYPIIPLRDVGTLVSRRTANGNVINASEAMTLDEALRAQTVNAAYAGFMEDKLGTIEAGKLADLVVLGEDPYEYPIEDFINLPVDAVVVDGVLTELR